MTTAEFSNEFDVLYNNITSNQAPGLDEYEKSVFLTQAQEDIVRCYFDPKSNKVQEGFDGSQKRQYDFSSLIKTTELTELKSMKEIMSDSDFNFPQPFDDKSIPFLSPNNLFLTINESIIDTENNERFLVVPITYDEYFRLKAKPYGMPLKRQAWRLITNEANKLARTGYYVDHDNPALNVIKVWFTSISSKPVTMVINYSATSQAPTITEEEDKIVITLKPKKGEMFSYWSGYLIRNNAELFKYIMPLDGAKFGSWPSVDLSSDVTISTVGSINSSNQIFEVIGKFKNVANLKYKIRYIEELKPIILTDLTDEDLSIKGYKEAMTSALPSSCHYEILKRAVELAKVAYTGGIQEALIVGNQSSTEIGHVSNQKN